MKINIDSKLLMKFEEICDEMEAEPEEVIQGIMIGFCEVVGSEERRIKKIATVIYKMKRRAYSLMQEAKDVDQFEKVRINVVPYTRGQY